MNNKFTKIVLALALLACGTATVSIARHGGGGHGGGHYGHGGHGHWGRGVGTGLGIGLGAGLLASGAAGVVESDTAEDDGAKDAEIARLKEEIAAIQDDGEGE